MRSADPHGTTFSQKLGLVASGLFLTVLVLEAALRLSGFILLSRQAHCNTLAMRQKDVYRIMCIGESTTRGQYPVFLERALNGRNLGIRFSVIDRGIGATNTTFLVDRLESDLDAYHPDMVVVMMGINDNGSHMSYEPVTSSKSASFFMTLRTYKAARISWQHLASLWRRAGDARHGAVAEKGKAVALNAQTAQAQQRFGSVLRPSPRRDEAHAELGAVEIRKGPIEPVAAVFQKAVPVDSTEAGTMRGWDRRIEMEAGPWKPATALKQVVVINPKDDGSYLSQGEAYRNQGKLRESIAALKKALAISPGNVHIYVEIGRSYRESGRFAEALAAFQNALAIAPKDFEANMELGLRYQSGGRFPEAAAAFQKALRIKPSSDGAYVGVAWAYLWGVGDLPELRRLLEKNSNEDFDKKDRAFSALSMVYAATVDHGLVIKYRNLVEQYRQTYNPVVARNYHRLKAMLDRRGVKLVCVQYPMHGLEPLRRIFQGRDEGIVFVDNEDVFRKAVARESLQDYFKDMFAGDFGHCTDKGNALLAGDIAAVLAREVFGE